jgi:hypothetical protein
MRSLRTFHAVAVKRHSSLRNRLFGLPGRIIYEQAIDVKENDEHALDFDLSPRANYTDRATAPCRRSDCKLLRIEGVTWSA